CLRSASRSGGAGRMTADEGDESEGAVRRVHAVGVRLGALLVTSAVRPIPPMSSVAGEDVQGTRLSSTLISGQAQLAAARISFSQAHIRLRMDGRRSAHPFIELRRVGFAPLPRVTLDVTSGCS